MTVNSYGILLFQRTEGGIRVLLAHPGGPFRAGKDNGAWSIPRGLQEQGETALQTVRREFCEEPGSAIEGRFIPLGELKQPSGKITHAWALEHDLGVTRIRSNTFSLEWPRRSGNIREYPEIDEGRWFCLEEARQKITVGQSGFLDRLLEHLQ